ncbi:tRNA (guanosine(37)-N1)-methyltransferase TrmD [Bifidobacterium callimiconis]|uniref:tRNA (guanosine(37)-N1)-methyltransferase TrmD n=1 Tax=Bifidobacterium callimiconis TaxID=2306973 RepID=UPI001BDC64D9|nr:tRNA (guanosine(37)-N1)-methyltransferase TrmD [Bifidobacterium callimiconis]MBT1177128.1 tRNA (guanosine(37)-N1)-methyltransferase TrmD [Bifidobacterium callimiconis]
MRIDIVSVFPEYFDVLKLSLLGKAQDKGLLSVTAHNLRDWTHDVHHSVDDTPVGGGAGMVMKPEVWAQCLDDVMGLAPVSFDDDGQPVQSRDFRLIGTDDDADDSADDAEAITDSNNSAVVDSVPADEATTDSPKPILIFPNPSAPLFTQADATELSRADHLVFGCGRYEGIDARVPEYYARQGVEVREYSIGDYVLNGGEVAVSAMIEAIVRLVPGFMGNPESIVEESYTGDPLLEHRQFTKPATWRGIAVDPVLTSGDHGKVDRYRRDEAMERTTRIRPDLVEELDCKALSKADRKTLMALGWNVSGQHPRH